MTTITHEHFLRQIQADADPRLSQSIYADWLEEQGDPRAALVRLSVEIRSRPEGQKQYDALDNAKRYVEEDRRLSWSDDGKAWRRWRHKAKMPIVRYRLRSHRNLLSTQEAWLWLPRKTQQSDSSKFQTWLKNREPATM